MNVAPSILFHFAYVVGLTELFWYLFVKLLYPTAAVDTVNSDLFSASVCGLQRLSVQYLVIDKLRACV